MKFIMNNISGIQFHCNKCNTIWIATNNSYIIKEMYFPYHGTHGRKARSTCPRCHNITWAESKLIVLNENDKIYDEVNEDETD